MSYIPSEAAEMQTPLLLLVPTITVINGVSKKKWPKTGPLFFGNFKTYGGTEQTVNGMYSIIDTAIIVTWYRPDITGACRIRRAEDEAEFEVMGEPEDIEQRHQFMRFKVRRVKGGA